MTVRDLLFQLLNVENIDADVVVRCYGDKGTSIQNIDDVMGNSVYGDKIYLTINADKVLEDFEETSDDDQIEETLTADEIEEMDRPV